MYYARGGDSLNFSAGGPGNAVLIKSGHPWLDRISDHAALERMQSLNRTARAGPARSAACAPARPCCARPWG